MTSQSPLSTQIDELMATCTSSTTPGAAVLVIKNGEILHKAGYGLADIEQGIPITPQTIFQIASTGKQFTTLALLMLRDEGKLHLDDPVSQYLPQLTRFGSDVTLQRIMNHVSGLPNYDEEPELLERLKAMAPMPVNAHEVELLEQHGELRFKPGERFEYNNFAYEVLGSVVEKVSGQPFQDFLAERIFDPLGMTSTFSQPNPTRLIDPRLAHSYRMKDDHLEAYDSDPMDHLVGAGSVYTTAEDMAIYDQALYTEQLVKQATLAEAYKPAALNDGTLSNYGYGWDLGEIDGEPTIGHEGDWLAFISYYIRLPRNKVGVMVFFNRSYDLPADSPAKAIARLYLNSLR
jgi:CubicO group peptidase (beta-lactamase class C family)